MNKMIRLSAVITASALLSIGCVSKQKVKPEEKPTAVATPEAAKPTKNKKTSYVVKKGDNLWKIAARSSVLGDSFRWPLLFKANRDQIEDPDLIEAKQDLSFKKSYSKAEIEEAVQKAKETPPFVPHAAPRKSLPVKY